MIETDKNKRIIQISVVILSIALIPLLVTYFNLINEKLELPNKTYSQIVENTGLIENYTEYDQTNAIEKVSLLNSNPSDIQNEINANIEIDEENLGNNNADNLISTVQNIPISTIKLGITEDTYTESGYPYASPWDTRSFLVGYDNQWMKQKTRSYLKYSLADFAIYEILPRDIVSAELNIWQYYNESNSDYQVDIGVPSSNWSQYNINWFNQPSSDNYYSYTISKTIGRKTLEIKSIVFNQLVNNNWENGISLIASNENLNGGIFWSNACIYTPDLPRCEPGQEPFVLVSYKQNVPPTKANLQYPINSNGNPEYIDNRNIIFNWGISQDPNEDEITYYVEISDTQDFSTIIHNSEGLSENKYEYTFEEDGLYFWRVKSEDTRIKNKRYVYSDIAYFEIDTTAPDTPKIDFIPPVTFGKNIVISWQFDSGSESNPVTFGIEKICDTNGEQLICEEKSTAYLNELFTNELEDVIFCYRLFARDHLGHQSEYSETVCSQHDFTPPIFTTFTVGQQYLSPQSSPEVQDKLEISYSLKETNLTNASLIIENQNREIVIESPITEIEDTLIPDIQDLPEGNYFVYASALDIVGQVSLSQMIPFIIDNTPPLKPNIISPTNNLLTNQKEIKFEALIDPYAKTEVLTSINSNSRENKSIFTTELTSRFKSKLSADANTLYEGLNKIKVVTKDRAGNSSESIIEFLTDWTKPTKPIIELSADDQSKNLYATISSVGADKYYIYNLAGLHAVTENTSGKILLVENWSGNSTYSFSAVATDKSGNISERSEIYSYTTPSVKGASLFGIGSIIDPTFKPALIPLTSQCLYKYQITDNLITKVSCNLSAPTIEKNYNYSSNKEKYLVRTYGADNDKLSLTVEAYRCKKKSFFDPRTWFKCFEEQLPSKTNVISTYGAVYGIFPDSRNHFAVRETINDTGVRLDFFKNGDYSGQNISIEKEMIFSQKIGQSWLDFHETVPRSNEQIISQLIYNPIGDGSNKYFRFPFNKVVGVTQWHGYTAFQSPHMGIDFGVYREPIYAIADGYVGYVGWDNFGGECLTGGNMIKIIHDNGMSSLYAHLENYKKADGTDLVYGERVKKGDLIGLTGNSGYYNCEPLGYHLHFELRKDQWQSSHINPTDWIDVDWDAINTLNADWYPGRLSGDNPHPTF